METNDKVKLMNIRKTVRPCGTTYKLILVRAIDQDADGMYIEVADRNTFSVSGELYVDNATGKRKWSWDHCTKENKKIIMSLINEYAKEDNFVEVK